MKKNEFIFTSANIENFSKWVNLSFEDSPINNRYKNSFLEVWSICFMPGLSFNQVFTLLATIMRCPVFPD